MRVFIPSTGGEFSGKSRREVVLVRVKVRCRCIQVAICCGKCVLELDAGIYCISEGTEGIWSHGQIGSGASVKSVPHVSNNAFELQHIV